jgi:lipopolysaccharide/colanic/teichoic acid biosynthesis glycosyltransferase
MTFDNGTATAPTQGFSASIRPGGQVADRPVIAPRVAERQQRTRPAITPAPGAHVEQVLPRHFFLAQLHREKRRADRSGMLLSLVIYRLARSTPPSDEAHLRDLLLHSKRETDILGQLDDNVLAVICPDTGAEGIHRFIDKIDARSGDLPYSVESATYPDHLFDGLNASPTAFLGPNPLLLSDRHARSSDAYVLKRPLDILAGLVALVLLSPLMLITALAVKLSSPGPVIFRQTRLGKDGVPFCFYKFRSMVVNGDERIHREYVTALIKGDIDKLNHQDAAAQVFQKIKADPRVTWVGRFIRKTSIDELPQLFNVLKGDMSLVGPRPPLPYEAGNYHSWHLRRVLDLRPGITGLWQVEGRGKVTFDEMVRLDLRYIGSSSLGLDLRILAKTVPVVLSCDGAS